MKKVLVGVVLGLLTGIGVYAFSRRQAEVVVRNDLIPAPVEEAPVE